MKRPTPEFEILEDFKVATEIEENDKLHKEVIFIKELDTPLLKFYYETLFPKIDSFIFNTGIGFQKISELQPNLLREEYWVISNHGIFGSLKPPNQGYNEDVLKNYLNHIIILNNFQNMELIDKETWTIDLKYNNSIFKYKTRFISTFPEEVYLRYIDSKLGSIYSKKDLTRIQDFIIKDKFNRKNIVSIVQTIANNSEFNLDSTLSNLSQDIPKLVNSMVKSMLLKIPKEWEDNLIKILREYNEPYIDAILKNNLDIATKLKFKESISKKDELKSKYINYYINDVDLLDLIYLNNIIQKKEDLRLKIIKIKKYVAKDTRELITNYRGGM